MLVVKLDASFQGTMQLAADKQKDNTGDRAMGNSCHHIWNTTYGILLLYRRRTALETARNRKESNKNTGLTSVTGKGTERKGGQGLPPRVLLH